VNIPSPESEDTAKADRQQALAELKSGAVSHAGRATAFHMLTIVVGVVIGIMGVLWLIVYFAPTLFAAVPVIISFCASTNWLFPLACSVFFASAVLAQIFAVLLERKKEEIAALEKEIKQDP
jgi:uncharacterized membrane protein (DUF485 family)